MTAAKFRSINGDVQLLLEMLTYCRPAHTETVEAFCRKFLDGIPGVWADKAGNRIIRIGDAPVLWSSHTDTVHDKEGSQKIMYGGGIASLADGSDSSCLGADDTAGIWLMVQMIRRNVPGLYIFHAAEEVGGIGSGYIASRTPELLDGIKYAIALDRKGNNSVITHQGGRCCSDAFADALADQLGGKFYADDTGLFTDTANYTGIIPECTNISVGYYNAHTSKEYLDVSFLVNLLTKLCNIDFDRLPVKRSVKDKDYSDFWSKESGRDYYTGGDLYNLVLANPDIATDLLEDMGVDVSMFMEYLEAAGR